MTILQKYGIISASNADGLKRESESNMKKILSLLLILSCVLVLLAGCGDNGKKRAPVYQGMTITDTPLLASMSHNYSAYRIPLLDSNNVDNNGNHYGNYKGDHADRDEVIDEKNPFPENDKDENIEEEIKSSLNIVGSPDTIYYAEPNQDIYINIHIDNPDNFEIVSFILNGKKYSSYMFEDGSDMETIILKYNVGNASGIVEYTIDAIKYIEGTEIKDVIIDGNKTVVAGIKSNNQLAAKVSDVDIGTNVISFNVDIKDSDNLVAFSKGALKAVIYDGANIIAEKDLTVGENSVSFAGLKASTLYQYAVVGYYDDLSGAGFKMNVLYKDAFYTESVVLFDNIVLWTDSIDFSLIWYENHQEKHLTSLKLYKDGKLERTLDVGATSIGGLLSANTYSIVAEYQNGDKTESICLEFTTFAKGIPGFNFSTKDVTQTSVSFSIVEVDADNVGAITKIELVHENGTVVADSIDRRTFENLLSGNSYTIKATYTYNLNDGNGEKTIVKELVIATAAKAKPSISIEDSAASSTSIEFKINETDADSVGAITKIELVHKNGTTVAENVDVRKFTNLVSNNEYVIKVTYVYDLNDGKGVQTLTKELEITTLAKALPVFEIKNEEVDKTSIKAEYVHTDIDNVLIDYKIDFYKGDTFVAGDIDAIDFGSLDFYTDYTIKITYRYDLDDGRGIQTATFIRTIKTASSGFTYTVSGNTCTITGLGTCTDTDVAIPEFINGCKVTGIGASAFADATNIKTIYLPNTIKTIGNKAFYNCTGITEITIPESVTSIGTQMFYRASSLSTVYYNSSYASLSNPFLNLNHITKVVFGGKTVPSNILANNTSVRDVVMLDSVQSIQSGAFYNCTHLNTVVLSHGIQTISSEAFYGCASLMSIEVPDSVTSIGSHAFDGCWALKSIALPENLKEISSYTFAGSGITYIRIPSGVKTVNSNAFSSTYLAKIFIPSSVTKVYEDAFDGVSGGMAGTTVLYEGSSSDWSNILVSVGTNCYYEVFYNTTINDDGVVFSSNGDGTCSCIGAVDYSPNKLIIPSTSPKGDRVTAIVDHAFSFTDIRGISIPGSVRKIGNNAFEQCENLKSITIADGLISIGYYAFCHCRGLTEIVLPESISAIESYAFAGCAGLTNITLSSGITVISDGAFCGCESLTSINIPEGVISIGYYAFGDCGNLASVSIPETLKEVQEQAFYGCPDTIYTEYDNAYYLGNEANPYRLLIKAKSTDITSCKIHENTTAIAKDAFYNCYNLRNIVIPDKVTYIGSAFNNCRSLTSIIIGSGVTSIDDYAFAHCTGLASITIPEGVTSIGEYAFYECENLKSVIIPEGVASIGERTFYECISLKSVIIPEGVISIGEEAFYGCLLLENITIPDGVTSVGRSAFKKCFSLTSVTIGSGVTSISDHMFDWCEGLTSITIPEGVTRIGYSAFYGCTSLNNVVIPDSVTFIAHDAFFECPNLKYNEYDNGKYLGNKDNPYRVLIGIIMRNASFLPIHEDTKVIADWALESTNLIEIIIPDGLTHINEGAFMYNSSLVSVTIPDSVIEIGAHVFEGCNRLVYNVYDNGYYLGNESNPYRVFVKAGNTNIDYCAIHEDTAIIADDAFLGCARLTSIDIPKGVISIGRAAFMDCTSLVSIEIPDGVTSIGMYAFYNCSSLESINIPDSVISIGNSAFAGCTSLESIHIPNSVISIGDYAFSGCSGLKKITNFNSNISIGEGIFAECESLKTFEIPDGFTEVVRSMFFNAKLTSITIPISVTKLGGSAFHNCPDLAITYEGTIAQWNAIVDEGCDGGQEIMTFFVYCSDGILCLQFAW